MTRSIYALVLSSVVALTCALSISNIASAAAPGGGAPGAGAGGGAGARGGRGGAGGAGGGAGAFGGGAGGAGGGAGAFGGAGGAGGAGGIGGGRGGGRGGAGGPPAPVPPEVAIPRPTADELAKINANLKSFISTSSDKDLLTKYSSLLTVTPPRDNPCIRPTQRQAARHDAFVATAKAGGIDILFEGDSITDWWTQGDAKKAVFDKYFGDAKVANFAIAGDTTQGVLWGLQNGEARNTDGTPVAIKPKAIMIMIGTNNMGGSTPAEIAEGIGAIVLENRKDFPDAKIMLLAIFPRGTPTDQNRARIAECNKIISKLDDKQHVFYMDIGDKFLDPSTKAFLPDSFQSDNLHPGPKGYEIWGAAVADTLKSWAK